MHQQWAATCGFLLPIGELLLWQKQQRRSIYNRENKRDREEEEKKNNNSFQYNLEDSRYKTRQRLLVSLKAKRGLSYTERIAPKGRCPQRWYKFQSLRCWLYIARSSHRATILERMIYILYSIYYIRGCEVYKCANKTTLAT